MWLKRDEVFLNMDNVRSIEVWPDGSVFVIRLCFGPQDHIEICDAFRDQDSAVVWIDTLLRSECEIACWDSSKRVFSYRV